MAPPQANRHRSKLLVEVVIVAALVGASVWYGRFAFLNAAAPPDYYYLSPSVMVATGEGLRAPQPAPGSPLEAFLAGEIDRIDPHEVAPVSLAAPDAFQGATRYLLLTIGYWWRVTEISWARVADVAAGLHVMVVLGAYALLRLFLPIVLSTAGAAWMCASTLQLAFVPHVRDYSKAAFIVAALPLVVALALRATGARALYGVAATFGLVIGVGFGFRMDVAIMVPLAVGAILFFRGRRPWSGLREKAVAIAVLTIGLALPAWPVLSQLSRGGSNETHVVLLGLADAFDVGLDIAPSVYRFVPFYSDAYVATMVSAFGSEGASTPLAVPSPEYSAATRRLWNNIVLAFPADMYARGLASAAGVMNHLFRAPDPTAMTSPPPASDAWRTLHVALNRFDSLGPALAIALVVMASVVSLRHGAFAALLVLALAGYPALQFMERHYFHLQVLPLFALLGLVGAAAVPVRQMLRRDRVAASTEGAGWARGAVRAAIGLSMAAALTVVPLAGLRALQAPRVERLVDDALRVSRTPVRIDWEPAGPGSWLARWPPLARLESARVRMSYHLLEFDAVDDREIAIGLRYDSSAPGANYSRVLSLTPASGLNRIGFAVLTVDDVSSFVGVEMGEATRARFRQAYRIEAAPGGMPIDLLLPADWKGRARFQALRVEGRGAVARNVVCAVAPDCRGLMGFVDAAAALPPFIDLDAATVHAPGVDLSAGQVAFDAWVESDSSYLAQLRGRDVSAGSAFMATGRLDPGGGLIVGLLYRTRWAGQALVNAPGEFITVVPTAEAGEHLPLFTNAMPPGRRRNGVTVAAAAFSEAVVP